VLAIRYEGSGRQRHKVVTATCAWCAEPTEVSGVRGLERVRRGRVYCTPACLKLRRALTARETMIKTNRVHASARMSRRNAERTPEQQARITAGIRLAIAEQRMTPWGGRRAGNGKAPTQSEQVVHAALSPLGFTLNGIISTGQRRPGVPTHYKLDLICADRKLVVEVDGSSHKGRGAQDARKDDWLTSHGWKVLRVPAPLPDGAIRWLLDECSPSKSFRPCVLRFMI
jgi:hypothetical protein